MRLTKITSVGVGVVETLTEWLNHGSEQALVVGGLMGVCALGAQAMENRSTHQLRDNHETEVLLGQVAFERAVGHYESLINEGGSQQLQLAFEPQGE
jgi:hypothetical protein